MASKSEQVLKAFVVGLKAHFAGVSITPALPVPVRNEETLAHGSAAGRLVVFDGEYEVLEETLSPHVYQIEHRIAIEVAVMGKGTSRDNRLSRILEEMGNFIDSDNTLGGRVVQMEAGIPEIGLAPVDGGAASGAKTAEVPVHVEYDVNNLLGT